MSISTAGFEELFDNSSSSNAYGANNSSSLDGGSSSATISNVNFQRRRNLEDSDSDDESDEEPIDFSQFAKSVIKENSLLAASINSIQVC